MDTLAVTTGSLPPGRPVTDVLLRAGQIAQVRAAYAEDESSLRDLNARLSTPSRLLRYFSVGREAGDRYVDHVMRAAAAGNTLLVEVDRRVVAVGSYFRLESDPAAADVSLLVDEEHRSAGIGTLLLEQLAAAAWQQGVTTFVAHVMVENATMLDVFTHSGLPLRRTRRRDITRVDIDLTPREDFWEVVQTREGAAERASLLFALAPRSVAVVGSSRPDGIARLVLDSVARAGFPGRVHVVGRHAVAISGCAGHERVGDIDGPVDLVVVAVPAAQVLSVALDSAAAHARALVVLSAGFAETGPDGAAAQRMLLALCRERGMRLLGPNCLGLINTDPQVRLNATFCDAEPRAGTVALVSQSGAVGIAALRHAEAAGTGLSMFVSTGNKADVSGNDLLAYLEHDPRTKVIALYLESFGSARKFARIAARVGRTKPIVVVKAGRSAAGRRAGSSHTAAAATPDVAVDALFEQAGVLRADNLPELFDIVGVLDAAPRPHGGRVVVIGNSGGPGILAADACAAAGLDVAPLRAETCEALRQLLPAAAAIGNPVDVLATASPSDYRQAVSLVMADSEVDAVLAIYTPLTRGAESAYAAALRQCADATPATALIACFPGVTQAPAELRDTSGRLAAPFFEFPELAAKALGRVVAHARWHASPFAHPAVLTGLDRPAARALTQQALLAARPDGWADPETAAAIVRCYGIDVPQSARVTSGAEAAAAARTLGTPVALKASGHDLVHKTDVGGVRLGLSTPAAVEDAYLDMQSRLGTSMTAGLVQPMVDVTNCVELVAGVVVDGTVGPLVLAGAGGIFTDILDDRALRVLPLDESRAREQLLSLRCAPMLTGARGRPPVDLDAVTDALVRLAALATDLPEVAELDINPLLAGPSGAVAVDVRIRLSARPPEAALPNRSLRSEGRLTRGSGADST